jgi:hypothetical protein
MRYHLSLQFIQNKYNCQAFFLNLKQSTREAQGYVLFVSGFNVYNTAMSV